MNNSDMPAMPFVEGDGACSVAMGLSKREYFAARAMQGLLSSGNFHATDSMAEEAWGAADCMLFMQEKEPTQ